MVSVSAPSEVTDIVLNNVKECNDQLQGEKIGKQEETEAENDRCPLCLCKAEDPIFILQSCGHAYCAECVKQYFESCIADKCFPMKCCEENCGRNLVVKDLNMLIANKAERTSFISAAVGNFVMKHSNCYKYCPTPNCSMVYRITDEQNLKAFNCPACTTSTCTACHQNAHDGFQSCIAWRAYQDDGHVFEWAQEAGARQCPKCGTLIEKNEGCMHMACRCGAHICWACMEVFQSSGDCYNHQRLCSRKLPPQINRITPQTRAAPHNTHFGVHARAEAARRADGGDFDGNIQTEVVRRPDFNNFTANIRAGAPGRPDGAVPQHQQPEQKCVIL